MAKNLEKALSDWREDWINKMLSHSQHPATFWQAVADRVIKDRKKLGRDPLTPAGLDVTELSDAFRMLVTRHQEALNLEKMGHSEEALILYEAGVADCFSSQSPYDRLRSIYTKRQWYEDALRVCTEYVSQPERSGMGSHDYFRNHATRLTQKLRQQRKQSGLVESVG